MPRNKHLAILCLLALIVASVSIGEVGAVTPGTRLRLEPADLVVDLNQTFVVEVMIEEVADLGAFQFDLTYDPSILQVQEAALGDFLDSMARSVVPVGPDVNNADGRTAFGAASFGSGPGPSGAGVLATVTCIARGTGGTVLELQDVQVLDTTLNAQLITTEGSRIVVRRAERQAAAPQQTSAPEAGDAPTSFSSLLVAGLVLAISFAVILAIIVLGRRPTG